MLSKPVLIAFALFVAISIVSASRHTHSRSKVLNRSKVLSRAHALRGANALQSCGCSWANPSTCATNDGTYCNSVCCGPYRSAPAPAPAAPSSSNCGCSWASAAACGTNDGTVCNAVCCGPYRSAPAPAPAAPSSSNCGCSWASAATCGTNDGTVCNAVCCAPYRGSSPSSPSSPVSNSGYTGTAVTTRYWDCCKPSCSWPSNVPGGVQSVRSCLQDGVTTAPVNAPNICGGGGSAGGPNYVCNDQQPFTLNGQMYAFAASNVDCCSCYQLQFTNTALAGQTIIVQVTNKGGDLGTNHFDLMMPGGGTGIYNGCSSQYGSWNGGAQYGGISAVSQCYGLPGAVQPGCLWRFNTFQNADNPNVNFMRITCPSVLSSRSGCSA